MARTNSVLLALESPEKIAENNIAEIGTMVSLTTMFSTAPQITTGRGIRGAIVQRRITRASCGISEPEYT